MEDIDIYEDVSNVDLGSEIYKLEGQNKQLLDHIRKLESDIEKLCSQLVDMKQVQQNLSKNISELFKTAKLEIERKDRIIADLRKEVEDLMFNKGNNRIFKRQRNGSRINSPAKRFKTDLKIVDIKPEMVESEIKSEYKFDEKVKLENSIDENFKIVNRNDKSDVNNQCEQNLKTNLHEHNFISNERKDDRFIDKLKYNDEFSTRHRSNSKWTRSKSGDRNRGRSRSNDRYKRSRSNNRSRRRSRSNERFNSRNKDNVRYNRSTSIERNKCIENTARSSHSKSKDRKFSRSKSKDSRCESYKYRNRSRNRDEVRKSSPKIKNNPKTEKLINETERNANVHTPEPKQNAFIVIDDLEEGEIAPSPLSNKFDKREKNMENPQNYKIENNCAPLPKPEMKSITITEYRKRQKTEACITQEKSETKIVCNSSEMAIDNPNILLEVNKGQISEIKEQTNTDIVQSRIECETEDNKKLETKLEIENENPANIIMKTFTTDVLNEKKSCNSTSKIQEDSFGNNSLNTSNLEISSMSNDSASTSANNSLNSTGGRNRRRRCVVIGIKNKS